MWENRLHGSVIPNDTDIITALVVARPWGRGLRVDLVFGVRLTVSSVALSMAQSPAEPDAHRAKCIGCNHLGEKSN